MREQTMAIVKYPRTPHIPWSEGRSGRDIDLNDVSHFERMDRVIVTEKLDGENTSLYCDHIHARSLTFKNHPSRHWIRTRHAEIQYLMPGDYFRICGENVFAKHSIQYDRLTDYFYVFAVFDEQNNCLSWEDTVNQCEKYQLTHVPVLYEGPWDEEHIRSLMGSPSAFGDESEGYVVRNASPFYYDYFHQNVAKFVRENHVQTDEHWMNRPIIQNVLTETGSE